MLRKACYLKKIIITVLLSALYLFLTASLSLACVCDWAGPALENIGKKDIVIRARVAGFDESAKSKKERNKEKKAKKAKKPKKSKKQEKDEESQEEEQEEITRIPDFTLWMKLKVLQRYKGKASDSIKVWGDPGDTCRRNLGEFPVNSEWIFILKPIKENSPHGKKGDYEISSCGEFALKVQDKNVLGVLERIDKSVGLKHGWPFTKDFSNYIMELPLEDFKKIFEKKPEEKKKEKGDQFQNAEQSEDEYEEPGVESDEEMEQE